MSVEIISRGRISIVTDEQMQEIPKNTWFTYCQHRLACSHEKAIMKLTRKIPYNA